MAVTGAGWQALGTTVELRLAGEALDAARTAVEAQLTAIDEACSRFRADSELSRLNERSGQETTVSPLLAQAIAAALHAASATDGAADPTVGEALILAGYDRDFALLETADPAPPPVLKLRGVAGWQVVAFDPDAASVRVPQGVLLDLGASAKALAADLAAAAASAAADAGALVAVGGDVACAGEPPAEGWEVHVTDDHRSGPDGPGQRITIRGGGLATSSTTTRSWQRDGRILHHIIDPRTGVPCNSPWRTVSVAAADCVDANAAATAAIVKGADAPPWLDSLALPARLVAIDGRVIAVAGWPAESTPEAA